tara:strand:- start:787 stop:1029 length:243 start_codon:yes stop_codon:yes gene_type:complete
MTFLSSGLAKLFVANGILSDNACIEAWRMAGGCFSSIQNIIAVNNLDVDCGLGKKRKKTKKKINEKKKENRKKNKSVKPF